MQDHRSIGVVDQELSPCHFLKAFIICRMVEMAMSIDNVNAAYPILSKGDENPIGITSRIDKGCLSCSLTAYNVTI